MLRTRTGHHAHVVIETWKAMLSPRRFLATAVVAVPIMVVQQELTSGPWAGPLLIILTVGLLATAPVAYRMLLPIDAPPAQAPIRLAIYAGLGALAPLFLWGAPQLLGLHSFVNTTPTFIVSMGLFWVAGYGLGRDIELEERWTAARNRAEALAKAAETAQLMALRAQLDPHVLFNTLNAIAEWCQDAPDVAERALLDLSALLRQVLAGVRADGWRMEEELTLLRRYLGLFTIRDPDKYAFDIDSPDDVAHFEVPPMLLLPLAENAMTHGPGRGHRGTTRVRARIDGEQIIVEIKNPGIYKGRRPGGEGLATVERRLALSYGPAAELHIEGREDHTLTRVSWPARSLSSEVP